MPEQGAPTGHGRSSRWRRAPARRTCARGAPHFSTLVGGPYLVGAHQRPLRRRLSACRREHLSACRQWRGCLVVSAYFIAASASLLRLEIIFLPTSCSITEILPRCLICFTLYPPPLPPPLSFPCNETLFLHPPHARSCGSSGFERARPCKGNAGHPAPWSLLR